MLVVDASVAVAACHTPVGFASLRGHELVAPQLMLIEASSVLHEMAWREEITKPRAKTMLGRLLKAPVKIRRPAGLIESAWRVADELGWAKTYDAQYVALAQILDCQLVSVDERLLRGVARLGIAIRPREL
ncbi:MAG TPA: type II toxin-antitoxin system VapC family toxin [Solirubrobacteraceae bacterium]|nr:type II toxin-antitoxin system VapC family toxin [Solirubrobacteraceae bacterium]